MTAARTSPPRCTATNTGFSGVPRPRLPVEVYVSESLAGRFGTSGGEDPWGGAEPGTFVVTYDADGDEVTRMTLAVGDAP